MSEGVKLRVGGKKKSSRTGGKSTRTYTPATKGKPARRATKAYTTKTGKNVAARPATPAVPATPSITTYTSEPSQTSYSNATTATFKIPVTVVFVTGLSLVIVNNLANGKLKLLWEMVWDGVPIGNPLGNLTPIAGELIFVIVMSFIAEINEEISGVVFALFVGLWMVWSINNANSISNWAKALGIDTKAGAPIKQKNASSAK